MLMIKAWEKTLGKAYPKRITKEENIQTLDFEIKKKVINNK
jgi:hypothetical protein